MRWPWSKPETRESGGDFTDAVVRLIEAQAAGSAADASSTAAVEAAAGALSRAFASAGVEGPPHVLEAVTPAVLAQVGRDLVRSGDSHPRNRRGPAWAAWRCSRAQVLALRGRRAPAKLDGEGNLLRPVHVHDAPPPLRRAWCS